ncbi:MULTISPECIES: hypothetical protein [Bacteria]|uniref:hypothetical protein n=2 Tax=cellular organisms TaxID=131567 RepID=UPI0011E04567|nr:hypothetical protein [Stenotrophomonas maltophilia]MDZ5816576.1 hypothetical protein [Stenotrophomonas maltophilia]HDS1582199.1 hypothetical protein [Stenotrophomonas maltophilia]
MKRALIAVVAALLSGNALASPIYLSCYVGSGGDRTGFKVTLDENNGTATQTEGGSFSADASFDPTEVRYMRRDYHDWGRNGSQTFLMITRINRVDLSVTYEYKYLENGQVKPEKGYIQTGQCKVITPPARQF